MVSRVRHVSGAAHTGSYTGACQARPMARCDRVRDRVHMARPRGVALVPGLYMFRSAFVELYAGKACAIGLIVFFFILILTEINNRFVRVDK